MATRWVAANAWESNATVIMECSGDRASARALAAQIVQAVVDQGRSLDTALHRAVTQANVPGRDRALVQEIAYGVVRWYWPLEQLAAILLDSPVRRRDRDVHALILVGLYQLEHMGVPPHAAVSETVEAVVMLDKPWAKGLVNGVLRAFVRNREQMDTTWRDRAATDAHPEWLRQAIKDAWPDRWQAIIDANNQRPPMGLRVNLNAVSRPKYIDMLGAANIPFETEAIPPSAVVLAGSLPIDQVPAFAQGWVSVQDVAAQHAAFSLDLEPGLRVLDACAAPGGKAAHCLEVESGVELVALDIDTDRVERIKATLKRLGLHAECIAADARASAQWWDGRPFDRIVIDAPCSGTGVIRRHPDIKHHRRPADVAALGRLQQQLLQSLWPRLAFGGRLLYVTCSVLPEENENQIVSFLKGRRDAQEVPLTLPAGIPRQVGVQLLPGSNGGDGFYYACLKRAEGLS